MGESRAGFVSLIGRPNSGKSTVLNWLIGEKIALVSHKANATRKRSNVIVMHKDSQIIFVDTPGIHKKEKLLNEFMLDEALKAIGDCDLIIFTAAATDSLKHYEEFLDILSEQESSREHIILLNKVDMVSNDELLIKISEYQKYEDNFLALIPVSATKNRGKEQLLDEVIKHLPESPYLYDPEFITTEHIRDIYKEIIRESLFTNLSEEIPYESDVIVEKIEEFPEIEKVFATIVVEKGSQKGIIIGKGGTTLKRIGSVARRDIERFCEKKVFLKLHVSVKRGWTKDKDKMALVGYNME